MEDSKYEEAMEMLDEVHQALYPLVTFYDPSSISANLAIKINKFKQKMEWVRKEDYLDDLFKIKKGE
jgi:hypothetical protein